MTSDGEMRLYCDLPQINILETQFQQLFFISEIPQVPKLPHLVLISSIPIQMSED